EVRTREIRKKLEFRNMAIVYHRLAIPRTNHRSRIAKSEDRGQRSGFGCESFEGDAPGQDDQQSEQKPVDQIGFRAGGSGKKAQSSASHEPGKESAQVGQDIRAGREPQEHEQKDASA